MSHFLVMVVGEDIDYQLAPFHEYECTGIKDEFVSLTDETERCIENFKEFGNEGETFKDFLKRFNNIEQFYNSCDERKKEDFSFGLLNERKEVEKVYRFTNPNAKWDWYQTGGRWSGYLLLKNGEGTNSALKKDIDFEKMKEMAEQEAIEKYEEIEGLFENGIPSFKTLDEFGSDIEEYHNQPGKKEFVNKVIEKFPFIFNLDEFQFSKEKYVERAKQNAVVPFAVVKNRCWHEESEMGWWGVTHNKKEDWLDIFDDLLESVEEDELITIVDCHI